MNTQLNEQSETADLNHALSHNYLLCELTIRTWSGRSTDAEATKEVITAKAATKDAGKFNKNLMASAREELDAVTKSAASLRHFFYSKTLPWGAGGEGATKRGRRILATVASMDFLQEYKTYKQEYDAAVRALVAVWDVRVAQAIQNLGLMADATEYPTALEIPKKFAITIDMEPVPDQQSFAKLAVPAVLAASLGRRHQLRAEQQVTNAMNEMRDRMLTELERIHTQMSKHAAGEKTRLYESLITNMRGLVHMAKTMNLTNNPRLTELAERIELKLLQSPVSVYKDDPTKAAVLADDAKILATEAALEEIWK